MQCLWRTDNWGMCLHRLTHVLHLLYWPEKKKEKKWVRRRTVNMYKTNSRQPDVRRGRRGVQAELTHRGKVVPWPCKKWCSQCVCECVCGSETVNTAVCTKLEFNVNG